MLNEFCSKTLDEICSKKWFNYIFKLDSRENISLSREPSLHTDETDSNNRQNFSPVQQKGKKNILNLNIANEDLQHFFQ